MSLFIHVCVFVFPAALFHAPGTLGVLQKEVTCSHTVALLAWLCPARVPAACPGKSPENEPSGPWHLTESQNPGPLQLLGESQTDLGHLLLLLAGFWGRGEALGYTTTESIVW